MRVIKYQIKKNNSPNMEKYFDLFIHDKNMVLEFDKNGCLNNIVETDEPTLLKKYQGYEIFRQFINMKDSTIEKAFKTLKSQMEVNRHMKILSDIIDSDFVNAKQYFTDQAFNALNANKIDEAIKKFNEAYEYDSDYRIFINIAKCYTIKKDVNQSIEYLNKAFKKGFYDYSMILEDKYFSDLIHHSDAINMISKMYKEFPLIKMSVPVVTYLIKYNIIKIDDKPVNKKVDESSEIQKKELIQKQELEAIQKQELESYSNPVKKARFETYKQQRYFDPKEPNPHYYYDYSKSYQKPNSDDQQQINIISKPKDTSLEINNLLTGAISEGAQSNPGFN